MSGDARNDEHGEAGEEPAPMGIRNLPPPELPQRVSMAFPWEKSICPLRSP